MIFQSFDQNLVCCPLSRLFAKSVMSQMNNSHWNCTTKLHKMSLFMKKHRPSTLILRYVREEVNVRVFEVKLPQLVQWNPRKIKKYENMCTKSVEGCSTMASQILANCHLEWAANKTYRNHNFWIENPNLLKLSLLCF